MTCEFSASDRLPGSFEVAENCLKRSNFALVSAVLARARCELLIELVDLALCQVRSRTAADKLHDTVLGLEVGHLLVRNPHRLLQRFDAVFQPVRGIGRRVLLGAQLLAQIGVGHRVGDQRRLGRVARGEFDFEHIGQAAPLDVQVLAKPLDHLVLLDGGARLASKTCRPASGVPCLR